MRLSGSSLNYIGYVEGDDIYLGGVDLVVSDGFVGNICLKSWESLSKFISATLKTELKGNAMRFAGAALAKGAFDALKLRIQPERYGGAPLLAGFDMVKGPGWKISILQFKI